MSKTDMVSTDQQQHGRPLRVLFAAHASNLNGASRSLLDLLDGLDRQIIEPFVLLPHHGPIESQLIKMNIPYQVIRYPMDTKSPTFAKTVVKRIIRPFFQARINCLVRQRQFDLIHNNCLVALMGARVARSVGIPYICHVREFVEDQAVRFIDNGDARSILSDADLLIFISQAIAKEFQVWVPNTRNVVLFNAINANAPMLNRNRILQKEPVRMLLAGRISPAKCQLDAIRAVEILHKRNRDVELILVGSVSDLKYLKQCENHVELHNLEHLITITNFVNDLSELRSQCDIALMCSTHEALGRVTVEGMMAGCLVIGADAGATPEIIRDEENGLLYRVGDPVSLADRIEWVLDNPLKADAIAARGRDWALNNPAFDKAQYASQIVKLYKEILGVR